MKKINLFWLLAIIITLTAIIYQRKTGPTYPQNVEAKISDTVYKLKLITSHNSGKNATVKLDIADTNISAKLYYRKYPTNELWTSLTFERRKKAIDSFIMNKLFNKYEENVLTADLPYQPPAGKLEYYIELCKKNNIVFTNKEKPIRIRFKGLVPAIILIPHVLLIFFAMLVSNLAGLLALSKHKKYKLYGNLTFFLLLFGGMIFGPWVQHYAFGQAWTGIPFGLDLTDNKTLIAFIFWIIAFTGNIKKNRPHLVLIAAIILLLIYTIPHSMFGSELNYNTGEIISA
ncbi:MAG: hypothetical protein KAT68_04795 [Bacteroidales bacterium]|nr:hypothetical protein [Bacteroidales bacterium]